MLLWNASCGPAVRLVIFPAIRRDEVRADYLRYDALTAQEFDDSRRRFHAGKFPIAIVAIFYFP